MIPRRWLPARATVVRRVVLPVLIFATACALRAVFFSGFVLCDDAQEFAAAEYVTVHGPSLGDQFHLRFGTWVFNALAFRLLGVSETSFFLPTLLMSASIPVAGYAMLLAWGYPVLPAFAAALMIAAAPFEVLVGGLRANDLILAWLAALGLATLAVFHRRPIVQGVATACLFWLAFYVKIWAVYALPALGIYFLVRIVRDRRWSPAIAFVVASAVVHGATCLFWKSRTGAFLPFISLHAATYPVARADLPALFRVYPIMLFRGSEFGTTLFGSIAYLLLAGLGLKAAGTVLRARYRLDAHDVALLGYYGSFFLLLNFFPNSFVFDQFYSSPRIFRYLTPLSFPMTLHVAKMILDLARTPLPPAVARWLPVGLLAGVAGVNVFHTVRATEPTRNYRTELMAAIDEVRERRPPQLVAEQWIGYFLSSVYLKDLRPGTQIVVPVNVYEPQKCEAWLRQRQERLSVNALLLTGMGSCVHYGAHRDGFRLAYFQGPLHPAWNLVREFGTLRYLPTPEPVRLWQLTERIAESPPPPAEDVGGSPGELFRVGMTRFDAGDCADARRYYRALIEKFATTREAIDAKYFDTICFYRDGQWRDTIAGFEALVRDHPRSGWTPGAYYHMGLSWAALGDPERAREMYERVGREFPNETVLGRLAEDRLVEMGAQTGLLQRLGRWLHLR